MEGARAGVGTSLFAGKATLVAIDGVEKTNTIIVNDEVLRRRIWRSKTGSSSPTG